MRHNGGTIRKTAIGYMAAISCAGRRRAHRTRSLKQARQWIDREIATVRAGLAPLTPQQTMDYHAAAALLPAGVSMADAARAYAGANAEKPSPTVAAAWAAYLADKEAAGLRPRTRQQIRFLVGHLAKTFGHERLDQLSADRLGIHLGELARHPTSRNNFRRAWGSFFRWSIRRGHLLRNPIDGITPAKADAPVVGILTPDQAGRLLLAGGRLRPYLALGLFAGIRTGELMRLRWEDIGDGRIHIRSPTAKMREERYVDIRPPLDAWLDLERPGKGPVCPVAGSARDRWLDAARKAAGIGQWPSNALRHSYASYLLALTGDSAQVAHQLGHHNPETTWRHYRHLVTAAAAKTYFALTPVALLSRLRGSKVPSRSLLFPSGQEQLGAANCRESLQKRQKPRPH